ncbi:MAG: RES family NAD+ phosphorylase [Planctomycetes bacterium]|nr:RES family NAD+ phosphorylase [Planctomycetota bacterium]
MAQNAAARPGRPDASGVRLNRSGRSRGGKSYPAPGARGIRVKLHFWRIVKAKHAGTAFSGAGARLAGGRWNSQGISMIYTSGSRSLAMLEMLVHISSEDILKHYVFFELTFDETLVREVPISDLPRNWWRSPPIPAARRIGDLWIANLDRPILRIPSAVVRTEWNYLINPNHPDFDRIQIGPMEKIRLDKRLT